MMNEEDIAKLRKAGAQNQLIETLETKLDDFKEHIKYIRNIQYPTTDSYKRMEVVKGIVADIGLLVTELGKNL